MAGMEGLPSRYIYTGVLDLTNQSGFVILTLLVASDELILDRLVDQVQKHLIDNESSWLQKNYVIILHTVVKLKSCKTIQDHIINLICNNPKPFFESKEFQILDKDIVLILIKKDVMNIEEIDIWRYLVKWGTAQSILFKEKSAETNVTNWSESDFALFKKYLEPFIPHIRFHEITREDFYYHVRPYKKAIPENIYEDLMAYFMANISCKISTKLPSRKSVSFDSVIIEKDEAEIITNWIERRNTFSRQPFYQFILTYRATRDGFDYNKFIDNNVDNCNQAILGLIKVSGSTKIIGGYNPLGLRNCKRRSNTRDYYEDECYQQWESTEDSRVKNPSRAIFNREGTWMNFGNADLILNGKNGSCMLNNYEKKIWNNYKNNRNGIWELRGESNNRNLDRFVVDEFETFVVRRVTN
ncbi:13105_t:CDS:2 [Cetraspora pellucida]|uniref:13105_t:CDS:1 n=1 Tax=Cetraspora pellucida TaxID=1433469 RepID=A0ACA9LWT0_9GLOM|nr:13105_t:CDS:2 [Cetraspora pellucida]